MPIHIRKIELGGLGETELTDEDKLEYLGRDEGPYYLCLLGVWLTGPTPHGPWSVTVQNGETK